MTSGLRDLARKLTRSSLAKDTGRVAVGQVLFKGALYAGSIALSRELTVEEFARFGYFTLTARFLSIFFAAGLAIAATKFIAEAASGSRRGEEPEAILMLFVAAIAAGTLASPLYLPLLDDESVNLPGHWLLAGGIAQGSFLVASAAIFGTRRFDELLWPLMLGSAAMLGGVGLSVTTGSETPALVGYCLSFLLPSSLFARKLVAARLLRFKLPEASAVKSVLATSIPMLAVGVVTVTVSWLIARVLLEQVADIAEFNIFLIGMQWFVLVLFVPNALGNALFPRFLEDARQGRVDLKKGIAVALSVFLVLAGVAALGAAAAPLLSAVYGSNYEFAPDFVFTILIGSALAGAVTMLSYPLLAAIGVAAWLQINLVLLGVTLALLALWPPESALAAAAIICAGQITVIAATAVSLSRSRVTRRANHEAPRD